MSEVFVFGVTAYSALGLTDIIGVKHNLIQFVAAMTAGLWAKARWRNLGEVRSSEASS